MLVGVEVFGFFEDEVVFFFYGLAEPESGLGRVQPYGGFLWPGFGGSVYYELGSQEVGAFDED